MQNSSQYTYAFRAEAKAIVNAGARALWIALGVCSAGTLVCAQIPPPSRPAQSKPIVAAESEWARGNRVVLGVTQARIGFSARWRFERAANGDILLEKDESRAGQSIAGSLMVVGNGALARTIPATGSLPPARRRTLMTPLPPTRPIARKYQY